MLAEGEQDFACIVVCLVSVDPTVVLEIEENLNSNHSCATIINMHGLHTCLGCELMQLLKYVSHRSLSFQISKFWICSWFWCLVFTQHQRAEDGAS